MTAKFGYKDNTVLFGDSGGALFEVSCPRWDCVKKIKPHNSVVMAASTCLTAKKYFSLCVKGYLKEYDLTSGLADQPSHDWGKVLTGDESNLLIVDERGRFLIV